MAIASRISDPMMAMADERTIMTTDSGWMRRGEEYACCGPRATATF